MGAVDITMISVGRIVRVHLGLLSVISFTLGFVFKFLTLPHFSCDARHGVLLRGACVVGSHKAPNK